MIEPPPVSHALAKADDTADVIDDDSHREYINQLFAKYRTSLHRYLTRLVRHEDANELMQETFIRLLRRGDTERVESMARSLIFHTATNLARDLRRRRLSHRARDHVPIDEENAPADHRDPEQRLSDEQTLSAIERAIDSLPKDTRTIFLLHRYRELSYQQIAQLLRLSTRSVARKMAEALTYLGSVLSGLR